MRFIVVPFTPALLLRLKGGRLTLRDALDQAECWVADGEPGGPVHAAWQVAFSDLPAEVVPRPGTMLLKTLEDVVAPPVRKVKKVFG